MSKGMTWGNGTSGRQAPQPPSLKMALDRVPVSFTNITNAMGVLAAVIEEPYCVVGRDELVRAVRSHRALSRAIGISQDYRLLNDAVVFDRDPAVVIKLLPPGQVEPSAAACS